MKQQSILWVAGAESASPVRLSDLPLGDSTNSLLWLDLTGPGADDLATLGRALGLDTHTLEDALAPHERPKITHFGEYSFVTTYLAKYAAGRVQTWRISAYVLPDALITIRPDSDYDMADVTARWRQDPHLIAWGSRGLLQGLMDVLVDAQFDILDALDTATDELSRELFADKPDLKALQHRTFQVRGELAALHRVIPQTRDIVASVLRQSLAEGEPAEFRAYWEDVNDHVLRASEWIDSLRDLISSIFEASLALNDTRMNEVMKRLAAWAAIIAVPTLITGWFGMNVPYPGFSEVGGLLMAVGLVVVSVVTLFVIFKTHDWL